MLLLVYIITYISCAQHNACTVSPGLLKYPLPPFKYDQELTKILHQYQFKTSVLTSSSEKDGGDVVNDFDIEEEEILIENRLETLVAVDIANRLTQIWPIWPTVVMKIITNTQSKYQ